MTIFETLNAINVNEHTEKKGNLTYLSWAWAWAEVKKAFPDSFFTVYENAQGMNYHTDGRTCWVKTGLTVVDETSLEHIEYLPVMNYQNKSIPLNQVTSMDVNTAIQRSLTKAAARHGLGLYLYAGEDLPEEEAKPQEEVVQTKQTKEQEAKAKKDARVARWDGLAKVYGVGRSTMALAREELTESGKAAKKELEAYTDIEFDSLLRATERYLTDAGYQAQAIT